MKKAAISILSVLLSVCMLCGCGINSSARPSTEYTNIDQLLKHYENTGFTGDEESCARFVRDLAGITQKADKTFAYDTWTLKDNSDPENPVYEKKCLIYGHPCTLSIVVQKKRNWIGAISLSVESEDAFKMASGFTLGMYDAMGGSYECLINGEKSSDSKIKKLIEAGDSTASYAVIWPRSSIKWSALVQYDASGPVPKLIINTL